MGDVKTETRAGGEICLTKVDNLVVKIWYLYELNTKLCPELWKLTKRRDLLCKNVPKFAFLPSNILNKL